MPPLRAGPLCWSTGPARCSRRCGWRCRRCRGPHPDHAGAAAGQPGLRRLLLLPLGGEHPRGQGLHLRPALRDRALASPARRWSSSAEVATEVTAPALLETWYELGRIATLPPSRGRAGAGPPVRARHARAVHVHPGRAGRAGRARRRRAGAGLARRTRPAGRGDRRRGRRGGRGSTWRRPAVTVVLGDAGGSADGLAALGPVELSDGAGPSRRDRLAVPARRRWPGRRTTGRRSGAPTARGSPRPGSAARCWCVDARSTPRRCRRAGRVRSLACSSADRPHVPAPAGERCFLGGAVGDRECRSSRSGRRRDLRAAQWADLREIGAAARRPATPGCSTTAVALANWHDRHPRCSLLRRADRARPRAAGSGAARRTARSTARGPTRR